MTTPEQDLPHHHQGEYIEEQHLTHIRETWLDTTIENVTPLIPTDHDLLFEGRDSNHEKIEVLLPVEHGMDRKKKVIITAAAAASLAGLGIAVLMRGRFSSRARKGS